MVLDSRILPTAQVGNFGLARAGGLWDFSDMADAEDMRGRRLYDRLMELKPADLLEGEWASQAGVNRGFFTDLKKPTGGAPRSDTLRKLLRHIGRTEGDLFGHGTAKARSYEAGPGSDRSEQPRTRSADAGETAPVTRLDLSYSMGPGTDLDASYVDGEPFEFDIGFLRGLTITPPERLRIVDGIGDSMQPTLHDRDLLFIDVNQRDLNAQDRIWAIWLFGLGAVKRLRAIGADTVLVISDNPDIDDQEVNRKDIMIHGRVVGSIKRH